MSLSAFSAHLTNLKNTTYLDVLNCRRYGLQQIADFTINLFDAENLRLLIPYKR